MKATFIRLMAVTTLAALGIVPAGPTADAAPVTFYTIGEFENGSNTVGNASIQVTFQNEGTSVSPAGPYGSAGDFATNADFGTFVITATGGGSLSGSIGFTLDIFQVQPGAGSGQFVGQAQGTITLGDSDAFVQFASPLSFDITGPAGTTTTYTIVEADDGIAGRLNLDAPTASGPGISTVEGRITQTTAVIPEPGTVAMALTGLPLLGLSILRYRRRKQA